MSRKPSRQRELTPTGKLLTELYATDPNAAALKAWTLLIQPSRPPVLPAQAAVLDQSTRSSLTIDNVLLRVYTWKPPTASPTPSTILLTHGLGNSVAFLAPLVPLLLAHDYRVVAYDQPGSGESGGTTVDVRIMVNATGHLIRTLRPSLRGIVAFSVGTTASVIALTEVATAAAASSSPSQSQNHPSTPRPWLVALSMPTQTSTLYVPFLRKHGLTAAAATHLDEIFPRAAREAGVMIPQDVRAVLEHPDRGPGLEGWNVLVAQDRDDWMVRPEEVRWFVGALGGECDAERQGERQVRVLWTSGLGHFGMLNDESVLRSICGVFGRRREEGRSKI